MTRGISLKHEFVEYIPNETEEGTLYVSMVYATATHKCCCGCGQEVVTPLSPTDWSLTFDGQSLSLDPSIGNWSFRCQSHYWIRNSRVRWADRWSEQEIAAGRTRDRLAKERYYDQSEISRVNVDGEDTSFPKSSTGVWAKLKKWLGGS